MNTKEIVKGYEKLLIDLHNSPFAIAYREACYKLEEILKIRGEWDIMDVSDFTISSDNKFTVYFERYESGADSVIISFPEGLEELNVEEFKDWWINIVCDNVTKKERDLSEAKDKVIRFKKKIVAYTELEIEVPLDIISRLESLERAERIRKVRLNKAKSIKKSIFKDNED